MPNRVPGQRDGITTSPRQILLSNKNVTRVRGQIDSANAIDGSNTGNTDELRAGCLLGRITSSGKWVPLKFTRVAEGSSGSGSGNTGTVLNVDDASFFKVGDTITVEVAAGTANFTINAIDYPGNALTLDSAVDNPNIDGAVYARGDLAGAEVCRGVLNEYVKLIDTDDNTARDRLTGEILIQAFVDNDKVLGDLASVRSTTSVTHYLKNVMWGDEQGA